MRARVGHSKEGFRVLRLRVWTEDPFWVIPTLFLLAGVGLAFGLREIDGVLDVTPR